MGCFLEIITSVFSRTALENALKWQQHESAWRSFPCKWWHALNNQIGERSQKCQLSQSQVDFQDTPYSSSALNLSISCTGRALPRFTPVIAQGCQGVSDVAAPGLVRHISSFRRKWEEDAALPPVYGEASCPHLPCDTGERSTENLSWGQTHRKTLENFKRTKTKICSGKYQQKLNISAAICPAYSIKYKMYVWGCQRFGSYILL